MREYILYLHELNHHLNSIMDVNVLIDKSMAGDKDSFAVLFNLYRQNVLKQLVGLSNNEFDSNDMLQDTFIKAFLNMAKYDKNYPFSLWLNSIARNTFLDYVRRRTVKSNMLLIDTTAIVEILEDGTEEQIINNERKEQIASYIENLSPKYRKIVELRYYVGFDYKEISTELNIPEGTVKTNLYRAKEELRKMIKSIDL